MLGPALPTPASAQTALLSGTVRAGDTGEPLAGVLVSIEGTDRSALTDDAGRYRIDRVPPGTYTVRFSLLGHAPRSETVRLPAGSEPVLDVKLTVEPIRLRPLSVLLDRTRILGDPRRIDEIPGSAHYLSQEDLEDHTVLYDDILGVLRKIPGINIQDEEGYGLRPNIGMRGTGVDRSSKITLMEDGVLIAPAPYAAPAAYYFPVVGRMEAVEVRKGSSQIKYGPRTIGGALNLVSSSIPNRLTATADVEAGEDATRKIRAKLGDSYKRFGWLAETYQIETNGFKRLDGGGSTGFEIEDYLVKFRVNTDPASRTYQELELKFGLYDETSNETYLGLTDADFASNPNRRYLASQQDVMNAEQTQMQVRHFIRAGGRFDVTTTLYRNDFQRNWFKLQSVDGQKISTVLKNPGDFPAELGILRGADSELDALKVRANNREYYGQGIQSTLGLQFGGATVSNELELGVRFHQDQEDRFQHEDGFQMVGGTMVRTSNGAPGSQSNRVSDAEAWAFFVQDKIGFGKWILTPGLRYETIRFTRTDYAKDDPNRNGPTKVRENGVNVLIPGLGVSYAASPGVNLFGSVHKGFGPPGPGVSDTTKAEVSINYELGARYRRGEFSAQLAAFFSDYRNVLGKATLATGESGAGELFNGGEVDVMGLEISVDYDPAQGRDLGFTIPMHLAYTFTSAEFKSSFESNFEPWGAVEVGDELPYLPEHQLYASVGLERAKSRIYLTANYVSEMRTVAGQGPIPANQGTDDFLVFSLSAQYAVAPWSTLFAGVQNLTDQSYIVARRPAGARPGLPRTFLAGVQLNR
jgi:Fe(3+) dicitrate transport protein